MALTTTPKWDCPACTYLNWNFSAKCTLCGCPKPSDVIPKSTIAKFKHHTQALLAVNKTGSSGGNNSASGVSPAESRASASTFPSNSNSNANKWLCSLCTYSNWPNATVCTMCRMPQRNGALATSRLNDVRSGSRSESILAYASSHVATDAAGSAHTQDVARPRQLLEPNSAAQGQARSRGGRSGYRHSPNHIKKSSVSSTSASSLGKKWKCSACTYENWGRSIKCAICRSAKNRTPSPTLPDRPRSPGAVGGGSSKLMQEEEKQMQLPPSNQTPRDLNTWHWTYPSSSPPLSPSLRVTVSASVPSCSTSQSIIHSSSSREDLHQIRNRLSTTDLLFLSACRGVVSNDMAPVRAYLRHGSDRARQLTNDEVTVLNEPSKFTVGSTLVHLAVRFQCSEMLSLLLTPAPPEARKRLPSQTNLDLAASVREEASLSLQQHKGDWPCYFFTQLTTFTLPADVQKFCVSVQKKLLDEIVDREVQKELEEDAPIINWDTDISVQLQSRLYPLWNRTAGDCLLDSVLQATWGVVDREAILRRALADSLVDGASRFYERWKETEIAQAHAQGFSLEEEQLKSDWETILALADQQGHSLEQAHILVLTHILRRPIIVYGVKIVKNYRGENLGLVNFEGIYLPLLWEASFCWKTPIALAYTRGHFSALISIASDDTITSNPTWSNRKAHDCHVTYLPLVDSEGKSLPLHFLSEQEIGCEERLINEYCDCHVTRGGVLTAKQTVDSQHYSCAMVQLFDEWLDRFRKLDKRREAASYTSDSDS